MDVTKQSSLIDFHGKRKVGDSDWNPSKGGSKVSWSIVRMAKEKKRFNGLTMSVSQTEQPVIRTSTLHYLRECGERNFSARLFDHQRKTTAADNSIVPLAVIPMGYEDANESAKRNATHKAETKRRRKRLLQFGIQKFV